MTTKALKGKKILFANFPADGHFNPLTGLAVHLKEQGCEIEWYTSPTFAAKIGKLGIKHRPFRKAKDVSNNNFDKAFPESLRQKLVGYSTWGNPGWHTPIVFSDKDYHACNVFLKKCE